MIVRALAATLAMIALAVPAIAVEPATTVPGPEIGDGLPGLILAALLVGGFFVARKRRTRS